MLQPNTPRFYRCYYHIIVKLYVCSYVYISKQMFSNICFHCLVILQQLNADIFHSFIFCQSQVCFGKQIRSLECKQIRKWNGFQYKHCHRHVCPIAPMKNFKRIKYTTTYYLCIYNNNKMVKKMYFLSYVLNYFIALG